MSEQGTEKTNPLHVLERDGTGTGVWTHPAAETKQPEQPKQCECGQSDFDGRVWSWRGVGTRRVCVANSTLSGYCPSCGCRLSVVDGEPRVGEPYADLERDARRFRVVEKAMGSPLDSPFNTHRWHFETDGMDMRYAALGEYADALLGGETDLTHGGSSPAGDWREPMVDTSNSSNPTEAHVAKHLRSGLTHGRLDAMTEREAMAIVVRDAVVDALKQRVAELEAENAGLRAAIVALRKPRPSTDWRPAKHEPK